MQNNDSYLTNQQWNALELAIKKREQNIMSNNQWNPEWEEGIRNYVDSKVAEAVIELKELYNSFVDINEINVQTGNKMQEYIKKLAADVTHNSELCNEHISKSNEVLDSFAELCEANLTLTNQLRSYFAKIDLMQAQIDKLFETQAMLIADNAKIKVVAANSEYRNGACNNMKEYEEYEEIKNDLKRDNKGRFIKNETKR